ncbi:unnamed protein product [Closterium sp. NIES-53]
MLPYLFPDLAAFATVSLANPSGGPVLAHYSTVLPCTAAPSGSVSGLYLPSFSTNLVSGADLQDGGVDQFTPASQRVTHCTCARTGRHLATFARQPGSNLYTLTTESPLVPASSQVAASGQVFAAASRSCPESAPCSCRMASRVLVSGLPWSLPPLPSGPAPTCVTCVERRQRTAPHSSDFPPTEAPLQTLYMDVWGPARVRGQGHERYFLLVVDDYLRYTIVFPLRRKGEVTEVLIDWIRAARLQLRESLGSDFLVLHLHSDRGGEFSSDLLRAFCRAEGIRQRFTLPASPQQNGIAERRIGMVMDVARTSMIHAAAPHFLWPFAVQYAAHQINLQPRVSMPETSPTLRWTGKVGDASAFRVWGSRAFVRDLSADKLSSCAVPCVFLGFPPDAPGWQFYHPPRAVFCPPRTSHAVQPVEVAVYSGAAGGAEPERAEPWGAGSGGAEPERAEHGGAGSGGAEPKVADHAAGAGAIAGVGATGAAGPGGATVEFDFVAHCRLDYAASLVTGSGSASVCPPSVGSECALSTDVLEDRQEEFQCFPAALPHLKSMLLAPEGDPDAPDIPTPRSYITRDTARRTIILPQSHMVQQVHHDFTYSSPQATPLSTRHSLSALPSDESVELSGPTSGMGLMLGGRSPMVLTGHADASWELRWLTYLLTDLGEPPRSPPVLYVDNKAMLALCREHRLEHRTKHIALRYFLARELQQRGQLRLAYVASQAITVDIFTKALQPCDHQRFFTMLGLLALLDWSCDPQFSPLCLWGTAFLQGSLHEEIWLRRPPGFTGSFPAGPQWSLRRPVYGLRQAPREWHDTLRTTLAALGFAPSTADPSLFLRTDTALPPFYVLVYIEDLVFATSDTEALAHVTSELQKRHTCTDLGELTSYLGLRITRDRAQRTITLTQSHMVQQVVQRFGFTYSSPQSTPLPTSHLLSAPPSDESVEPSCPYPELVGCLMYLLTCTRPDLAYPLSLLARYVAPGRHRKVHWDAAKRVLRYLCSTSGMGLVLGGRARVVLTGHTDASWVDDLATQRSSQGYTFSLGSGSVSWRSTRTSSVLTSCCEAEIYAWAMAAQELRWLTYMVTDLGEAPRSPPVLYVDNKAMLALC